MRAREADALDAVDRIHRSEQLAEVRAEVGREVTPPRVHVLAEQRDLPDALAGQALDLGHDLARAAAPLPPAHRGHDAVRAARVAPHRDLHPRLERPLAHRRQQRGEGPLLSGAEAPALSSEPARAEPVGQVRDGAGPEGHVDEGVHVEEALSLGLRVAAADGDDALRITLLQRAGLGEMSREALIRLLADRARVEDHHVRLVLGQRLAEPELLEHALDALGVVRVHLAAERGDVVAPHSGRSVARARRWAGGTNGEGVDGPDEIRPLRHRRRPSGTAVIWRTRRRGSRG